MQPVAVMLFASLLLLAPGCARPTQAAASAPGSKSVMPHGGRPLLVWLGLAPDAADPLHGHLELLAHVHGTLTLKGSDGTIVTTIRLRPGSAHSGSGTALIRPTLSPGRYSVEVTADCQPTSRSPIDVARGGAGDPHLVAVVDTAFELHASARPDRMIAAPLRRPMPVPGHLRAGALLEPFPASLGAGRTLYLAPGDTGTGGALAAPLWAELVRPWPDASGACTRGLVRLVDDGTFLGVEGPHFQPTRRDFFVVKLDDFAATRLDHEDGDGP